MCLVVKYEPGIAYKLFYPSGIGLQSPMHHSRLNRKRGRFAYPIGKWLCDSSNGKLPFIGSSTSNNGATSFYSNVEGQQYLSGFHCFPSLADAQEAYRIAKGYIGVNCV